MLTKRLAELLAIGTGINGIYFTLRGSATIGLVFDILSVFAALIAFFIDYRKKHFLDQWRTGDF